MTRSHKFNDRDHSGDAAFEDGSQHLPRYFAKAGFVDADPKKTKKDGGGKGNWGRAGDELEDSAYNMANPRRRSNSSSHSAGQRQFKTKFETVEPEPVFEEELHGAPRGVVEDDTSVDLEHTSSNSTGSIEEEETLATADKKV